MGRKRGAERRLFLPGQVVRLAGVVLVCVVVPLGLGLWLDKRLQAAPWWTLLGMFVGVSASTAVVVRRVFVAYRGLDQEFATQRARRGMSRPLRAGSKKEDTE